MEPETIVRSARILLVEDDPVIVMQLRGLLHQAGYHQVRTTTEPAEVPGIHREWDPDLLLLDFHFPDQTGEEVLERLRPQLDTDDFFPILILTGDTRPETRLKALLLGAKDFVTKPFDPVELLIRIRILLDTRILFRRRRGSVESAL